MSFDSSPPFLKTSAAAADLAPSAAATSGADVVSIILLGVDLRVLLSASAISALGVGQICATGVPFLLGVWATFRPRSRVGEPLSSVPQWAKSALRGFSTCG